MKLRKHFCVNFDYTDTAGFSDSEIQQRFIEPAAAALRNRVAEYPDCTFLDLEIPSAVEQIKCGPLDGLPKFRALHAMNYRDIGSEDAPNFQLVHDGRLDVLIEVEHDCDFPALDFKEYGFAWECPVCNRKYQKSAFDGDMAMWEHQ